jgi:hypothetical protein
LDEEINQNKPRGHILICAQRSTAGVTTEQPDRLRRLAVLIEYDCLSRLLASKALSDVYPIRILIDVS